MRARQEITVRISSVFCTKLQGRRKGQSIGIQRKNTLHKTNMFCLAGVLLQSPWIVLACVTLRRWSRHKSAAMQATKHAKCQTQRNNYCTVPPSMLAGNLNKLRHLDSFSTKSDDFIRQRSSFCTQGDDRSASWRAITNQHLSKKSEKRKATRLYGTETNGTHIESNRTRT